MKVRGKMAKTGAGTKVTIRLADRPGDTSSFAELQELAENMGEESWQIRPGKKGGVENIAVLAETFSGHGKAASGSEKEAKAVIHAVASGDSAEIRTLFVHPEMRGKGIEEALIGKMAEEMNKRSIQNRSVKAGFHQIALFQQFGFE